MKLGANVGYFGAFGSPDPEMEYACEAERLGYDSLWVGEPYGNDASTVLGLVAGATERITLGSAILAIPGRTPAMCAQTAATIDFVSAGRFVLGLGTSGPQVSEGWHGVPFARQLQRTREYVDIVRLALAREEPVTYDGAVFRLPLPDGEGKPLKLILKPPRRSIPIYLAALGPRNLELCGEIADGWLPLWYAPEHSARLFRHVAAGARKAGREPNEVSVCPSVTFRIGDDVAAARELMRPALALYVGGMGSRRRNFYNRLIASYGYEEIARKVQVLYLDGRHAEAAAQLPDELIDLVCLCGPIARVRDRLAAYRDAGVHTLIGIPAAIDPADRIDQLRLLAEAAA